MSLGVFGVGGFGPSGGVSGNVGLDIDKGNKKVTGVTGVSGAKGFFGLGGGAAAGFQMCETIIYCDDDIGSCKK